MNQYRVELRYFSMSRLRWRFRHIIIPAQDTKEAVTKAHAELIDDSEEVTLIEKTYARRGAVLANVPE